MANELLDYAAAGDREGYRATRDRIRRQETELARDAEEWARMQIFMWRDNRFFSWRVNWLKGN